MVYCDYTASGRCLLFVERYLQSLQRIYANTHTEDDTDRPQHDAAAARGRNHDQGVRQRGTAGTHRRLRHRRDRRHRQAAADPRRCAAAGNARANGRRTRRVHRRARPARFRSAPACATAGRVRRAVRAPQQRSDLAAGSRDGRRGQPRGRRRHRSRASRGAAARSGVSDRVRIGSFSAASNVTGMRSPVHEIARLLHAHDAYRLFRLRGERALCRDRHESALVDDGGDASLDAVFLSPHKFLGGPGSSGVLVFNERLYSSDLRRASRAAAPWITSARTTRTSSPTSRSAKRPARPACCRR